MSSGVSNMRNIIVILAGFIVTSSATISDIEADFSKAVHKGLSDSINNYIFDIQERLSKVPLTPMLPESTIPQELTPDIIEKALNNLKDTLPERIPMIPFAVAEPTSSNVLFYFGILNSFFKNINTFTCKASVDNTVSSSSVDVIFHLNTSSLQGHYELDISSYDLHLYGDGEYSIISNGTDVSVLTNIEIFMDGSFKMSDFLFNISINSAQLAMSNLLGGDPSAQELTAAISEKIPAEVATLSRLIQQVVNNSVVDFTNSYFASMMSWSDVVAFVYYMAEI